MSAEADAEEISARLVCAHTPSVFRYADLPGDVDTSSAEYIDAGFKSPSDVAEGLDGSLFVADKAEFRISCLRPGSNEWAEVYSGDEGHNVTSISTDSRGRLAVVGAGRARVKVIDAATGVAVGSLHSEPLSCMSCVRWAADEKSVYVSDTYSRRVVQIYTDPKVPARYVNIGSFPRGVVEHPGTGELWICNNQDNILMRFDAEHNEVGTIARPDLYAPRAPAVCPMTGTVAVPGNGRDGRGKIHLYNANGTFRASLAGMLNTPWGCTFLSDGTLCVADSGNQSIAMIDVGLGMPPK
eukprot:m.53762 g.53762  ORF g.53762 m.53762 type:complete len:297 (+) comp12409_c0_seq2:161-1051(+)